MTGIFDHTFYQRSVRVLVALLYPVAIGLCTGALGAWFGVVISETVMKAGLIRPNANIDDDAMMIMMGFAMPGALIGFVGGVLWGWRIIKQDGSEP